MLQPNPINRITASEALKHPYFNDVPEEALALYKHKWSSIILLLFVFIQRNQCDKNINRSESGAMNDHKRLQSHMMATVVKRWKAKAILFPSPSSLNLSLEKLLSSNFCMKRTFYAIVGINNQGVDDSHIFQNREGHICHHQDNCYCW